MTHKNAFMRLTRREKPILVVTLLYSTTFTLIALRGSNYEFLLYAAVVIVVTAWIFWKQRLVRFEPTILWGLSGWGLLHMAGGNVPLGRDVLYSLQIIPTVLRYDQLVHGFGFGVATLVCHHLLRGYLRSDVRPRVALPVLVVLMGCGLGAINEIIEFIAVKSVPETHVGGYDNTLWDLIFNLIGSVIAVAWLNWRQVLVPAEHSREA